MKKGIRVILGIAVAGICGVYLIDFIQQVPEEWVLTASVPFVGLAIGLFFAGLLRAAFDNKQETR